MNIINSVDVTAGLKVNGAIIINTAKSREEIEKHLKGYTGRVYTIDARKISMETLGRISRNSPMLAATVAVSEVMPREDFFRDACFLSA